MQFTRTNIFKAWKVIMKLMNISDFYFFMGFNIPKVKKDLNNLTWFEHWSWLKIKQICSPIILFIQIIMLLLSKLLLATWRMMIYCISYTNREFTAFPVIECKKIIDPSPLIKISFMGVAREKYTLHYPMVPMILLQPVRL